MRARPADRVADGAVIAIASGSEPPRDLRARHDLQVARRGCAARAARPREAGVARRQQQRDHLVEQRVGQPVQRAPLLRGRRARPSHAAPASSELVGALDAVGDPSPLPVQECGRRGEVGLRRRV